MRRPHTNPMTVEQEITALADGSLRGTPLGKAEARLAARPDLLVSLARQRQAVAVLRELTPQLPPAMRTRIEEQRRRARNLPGTGFRDSAG